MNVFLGRIMWRGGYIGARQPCLRCKVPDGGGPVGAIGNPASRSVKPVTATGFPGRLAVAAAVHGVMAKGAAEGGEGVVCAPVLYNKKEGVHGLTNRALLHYVSLLSDSNQRPRDYKSRALAN